MISLTSHNRLVVSSHLIDRGQSFLLTFDHKTSPTSSKSRIRTISKADQTLWAPPRLCWSPPKHNLISSIWLYNSVGSAKPATSQLLPAAAAFQHLPRAPKPQAACSCSNSLLVFSSDTEPGQRGAGRLRFDALNAVTVVTGIYLKKHQAGTAHYDQLVFQWPQVCPCEQLMSFSWWHENVSDWKEQNKLEWDVFRWITESQVLLFPLERYLM